MRRDAAAPGRWSSSVDPEAKSGVKTSEVVESILRWIGPHDDEGNGVTPKQACAEWARILRSVASGDMKPAEALAKRPIVEDEDSVPGAFFSVIHTLENHVEFGFDDEPDSEAYFANELRRLADRIEGISRVP